MKSPQKTAEILDVALKQGGEWADFFLEETVKNRASLSDKTVKTVAQNQMAGAGIRVISGLKEYYAYTNDLSDAGLLKIARDLADAVGRSHRGVIARETQAMIDGSLGLNRVSESPFDRMRWEDRVSLLREADALCRAVSPQIAQVNVSYLDESQVVLIANSDGLYREGRRNRGRFAITAVSAEGDQKQMGYEAPGSQRGPDFFQTLNLAALCRDISESAVRMLSAPYAPSGKMPVIIDSGFGGVIFHEACGHLLEASAVAKQATVLAGRLNEVIAASCVSAVDDGTLQDEWGSSVFDDEGAPTKRNLLIENGVLRSYLVDRLNGERLSLSSTGSSRRESYRFAPTSRMNNTYILPGTDSLAQMIEDTPYGLYAKRLGGGSVNPATGEFNFAVTEGYLIQNGQLTHPVRGAVLIGRGEEILKQIDRVGSELKLAQGMCGASSGWVPVNVGQPPIRVQGMLVGGQGTS